MPFCISNNTALDCITVRQDRSSLGNALTLPPLSSQLWTLPLVNGPQKIHISTQRIGTELSKSCFATPLTVDITKPGKLGTIQLKDPQRTLSVSLEIQKSMRVIVIEEVNKKQFFSKVKEKNLIHYLLERRHDLTNINNEVKDTLEKYESTIANYIQEQENSGSGIPPSACFTYLQVVCSYSDSFGGQSMRGQVQMRVNGKDLETSSARGAVNYYGFTAVANEMDKLDMILELHTDLLRKETGNASLPLDQFKERDRLYDIIVPFYSKDYGQIGFVNVRFVNTVAKQIAEVAFKKAELELQQSLIEATIQKLHMEAYLERTLSKKKSKTPGKSSRHVLRATHSGVYSPRSSSTSSSSSQSSMAPMLSSLSSSSVSRSFSLSYSSYGSTLSLEQLQSLDNEEIADDMESKMNYCVTIDQLKTLLEVNALEGCYITLKIGSSELRTVVSSDLFAEERETPREIRLAVDSLNFGCGFSKNGNAIIVNSVDHNSLAEQEGVQVGDVLTAVNDGDVPPTIEELDMLLHSCDENVLDFQAKYPDTSICARFGQQLIFPKGVTVGEVAMTIHVYKESDESEEDTLLGGCEMPIIRESDVGLDIYLEPEFSCSLSTSWSSFDPEEELIKMDVSLNLRGIGLSIINEKPEELLYLSLNKMVLNMSIYETGKITAETMLNTFQVDNQVQMARFPVLFGSPFDTSKMNWLHAAIIILPHPSVLYIEYCSVLIQVYISFCSVNPLGNEDLCGLEHSESAASVYQRSSARFTPDFHQRSA